jgi:hypothetical protein
MTTYEGFALTVAGCEGVPSKTGVRATQLRRVIEYM